MRKFSVIIDFSISSQLSFAVKLDMELVGLAVLIMYLGVQVNSSPFPGHTHHHVHHRIHVPQKIKTIYHTKIIKIPEHHHYYHEKEKLIAIEAHKEEPVYPPLKEEEFGIVDHHGLYDGSEHNILKKHTLSHSKETKKRKVSNKIK